MSASTRAERIVGVDLGERHVGVAVWDDPDLPARPLETLSVTPETLLSALVDLAKRESPTQLVLGLPLRLDGRESTKSRQARRVARALEKLTGVPVALQDERLTTSQAHTHRVMAGAKGRAGIDARAAAILLQAFVDARQGAWRNNDGDDR